MIAQDLGDLIGPVFVFRGAQSNLHAWDALLSTGAGFGVPTGFPDDVICLVEPWCVRGSAVGT